MSNITLPPIKTGRGFDLSEVQKQFALVLNKQVLRDIAEEPTSRILNLDRLSVEQLMVFMTSQHSQSWGRFDVGRMDTCQMAAEWFMKQLNALYEFRLEHPEVDQVS